MEWKFLESQKVSSFPFLWKQPAGRFYKPFLYIYGHWAVLLAEKCPNLGYKHRIKPSMSHEKEHIWTHLLLIFFLFPQRNLLKDSFSFRHTWEYIKWFFFREIAVWENYFFVIFNYIFIFFSAILFLHLYGETTDIY